VQQLRGAAENLSACVTIACKKLEGASEGKRLSAAGNVLAGVAFRRLTRRFAEGSGEAASADRRSPAENLARDQ